MVEEAWLDKGDVILPKAAMENFERLIEWETDIISDLKSISENETYSHMKQAVLDLINELEEKTT